jgi:hypothetical protein
MRALLLALLVVAGSFALASYDASDYPHGFRVGEHHVDSTVTHVGADYILVRPDGGNAKDFVPPEQFEDYRRLGLRASNLMRVQEALVRARGVHASPESSAGGESPADAPADAACAAAHPATAILARRPATFVVAPEGGISERGE